MEFVKKNLHQMGIKKKAVSQVTFDEDVNVPDAKPDVGRMIQKKGRIEISEVPVSEGKVKVIGTLQFWLLYVPDGEKKKIQCLEGRIPFEETIHLDGLANGDKVCLKWELEDLSVQLVNSRKLGIRGVASFWAFVEDPVDLSVPVDVKQAKDVTVKKQEERVLQLETRKKDIIRIKKEVSLPSGKPEIHEMIWQEVEVCNLELRAEEGKVTARGDLSVFCLYEGEDSDHSLQWMEQMVPFTGEADCPGASLEGIPVMEATLGQTGLAAVPDADGEERILQADVVLELDIRLYREETISLLQDVYTPKKECRVTWKPETLESLLIHNSSKCRVSDRVELSAVENKILQICHTEGNIKIDEEKMVTNGIQVQGVVEIRVLFLVSDDDMPFSAAEAVIPFRHVIEVPGIEKDCRYDLNGILEQISTTMLDSNEIEVKAVLGLDALVVRQHTERILQQVEERDLDPELISSLPGIVCYLVRPGDTLWDIAKKYYTTTEEIRSLNGLKDDHLEPMQQLILVKEVQEEN